MSENRKPIFLARKPIFPSPKHAFLARKTKNTKKTNIFETMGGGELGLDSVVWKILVFLVFLVFPARKIGSSLKILVF